EALKALGRRHGATLFMTLTAAFQALLSRYTGQTDFALGTPVAGRDRVELEGLIGFFVNTLALRADLAGDPPFVELQERVRRAALDGFAHQELPFEKLIEELNPERSFAQTPLFQAMCVLQNAPGAALDVPGLRIEAMAAASGAAKYDLTLTLGEHAWGMGGSLEYRSELFDAATVRRAVTHLVVLLEGIAVDPHARLSELPLLPAAERQQIVLWTEERGAYVVDEHGRLLPVGVPGELAIGGGGRLDRTGDLARLAPDGTLVTLGRIADRVSMRGFRFHLGEVEAVLAARPGVREAAVAVFGAGPDARLVGYVVPEGDGPGLLESLRAELLDWLPDYMVPIRFVALPAIDRAALPEPEDAPELPEGSAAPAGELDEMLAALWCVVLGVPAVGREESFFDLGGHSLLLVDLQSRLRERLGEEVEMVDLFRYPNVRAQAAFLMRRRLRGTEAKEALAPVRPRADAAGAGERSGAIAIVGMAGRFPGAADLTAFWDNLRNGVESISFFSREELAEAGVTDDLLADPKFVPAGGVLEGAELFDAPFFDVSPREAQLMDPQQRVFLECAAEALESGGYGAGSEALGRARVGVYAGAGMSSYGMMNLYGAGGALSVASPLEISLGNEKDFLPLRTAYKLNLRGPAVSVQTACSTALVAVHTAVKAIQGGECDVALAGGITIQFPQRYGYFYEEGGTMSPDGHSRTFDVLAKGAVAGNGVGVVML
ncbi:MAG TPA: beta-ketoacyl synthase N-terminal-like domain-containing protein, partial [Thermoanaerobaculia bacterium]